ncbi:hypothetical protein BDW62DRAFT_176779 [Aspergillus aurantiobrunneus]
MLVRTVINIILVPIPTDSAAEPTLNLNHGSTLVNNCRWRSRGDSRKERTPSRLLARSSSSHQCPPPKLVINRSPNRARSRRGSSSSSPFRGP